MPDSTNNDIDSIPRAGQNISHGGKEYTTIKEGLACILVPQGTPTSTDPKKSKEDTQKQQVFYNPIQQFNRDLSVLAIKTFGEDLCQRRRDKHEKSVARLQKRKACQTTNGQAADVQDSAHTQTNGVSSKKRKLEQASDDEGIPGTDGLPVKRPKPEESIGNDKNADAEDITNFKESAAQTTVDVEPENTSNWAPPFTILDALSATGLRALRYANEIPSATSITANDMSSKATDSIALNVKHNKLESKISAHTGNAIAYMYSYTDKKGFDVIDLDPYGTAAPFIDAAIQAINDEGLLCVTCTDSAIFASHGYLEKTYSQYGGLPFKGEACHEGGLRLILHAIATSAGRYGMAIEPLLSLSIDYYVRVFVRVRKSPNEVKLLAGKTMIVYNCDSGCGSWTTQYLARNKESQNKKGEATYKHAFAQGPSTNERCKHCGFKTHLCGPMYGGPLHNVGFIQRILAQLNEVNSKTYPTKDRIEGMLHTALEEITFGTKDTSSKADIVEKLGPLIPKTNPAELDQSPFFFIPSTMSKVVHCSAPSTAAMRGALRHAGFRTTMSHCKPGSIKTDASWEQLWHILLEWIRQEAPLKNQPRYATPGLAIISKGSAHHVEIAKRGSGNEETAETSKPPIENGDGLPNAVVEVSQPSYLDTKFEVKFDVKLGRDHDKGKYVRYQLAPRENWGPMARAK